MDLGELAAMAEREIRQRNLHGWTFGFNDAKRRLGVCKYRQKRIELARHHAQHSSNEEVIDTLMHEVAHALAGHAAGHGPLWKAIAKSVGASPKSCAKAGTVALPPADWQAHCSACDRKFHRYRRPKRLDGYRCRCPAKTPLAFAYVGDPVKFAPAPPPRRAPWRATCPACGMEHGKVRQPAAGVWYCKCPGRGTLEWKYQPA